MPARTHRIILLTLAGALLLYVTQAFTPLRLDTDGIHYLSLADDAATQGFADTIWSRAFSFPKGYPVFVFLMMKAHLFSSATLVLSNLLFLCSALVLSLLTLLNLGFSKLESTLACLLTLVSFAVVKHITQGRSDFLFFFLASLACWTITLTGWRRWLLLAPCVACAVEVRFIGLALLPPIAVELWQQIRDNSFWKLVTVSLLVVGSAAGVLAGYKYLLWYSGLVQNIGLTPVLKNDVVSHIKDFTELASNAPLSKLPAALHAPLLVFGVFAFGLIVTGTVRLWRRSRWLSCYLIACGALVLPWPYTDPRFWLPVMPFVFVAMHIGCQAILPRQRPQLIAAYIVLFCAMGFLALGYSTWLTFSGPKFAYRYGDGLLANIYAARCEAYDSDPLKEDAARLLQRYEWHCGGSPVARVLKTGQSDAAQNLR